jgi:hypothetical protein
MLYKCFTNVIQLVYECLIMYDIIRSWLFAMHVE